jgi:hypothetical protein
LNPDDLSAPDDPEKAGRTLRPVGWTLTFGHAELRQARLPMASLLPVLEERMAGGPDAFASQTTITTPWR